MFFRKKDEVKKKKQSEMAAKYPSATPRTDVTAVVTRKSAPEWAATSSRKAAPAVLRNVNEKPQPEKFPLYTGGKPTAEPAVLRNRNYAVQAATGWKQYQTDESNRTRLAADRGYQKWQSRGGVADAIDVSYKPAKNWRVSENNTFGYLYAENKERAHSYAKSLNDLLSKQMDEIGDSLREGAQGQAEKIKDWGEKVWNTHTEAQQANAAAHEAQAEQVGQIGKQVLQKGKAAAEEAWKQQAEIQNRNSVQQIQRGKTQADAAMKAGKTAMQQAGALALAQANVQKTLTDTISNVYTDFFSNPNWGKTVYETSGVTGSDQTGASIHGYRNDTHSDEHDEEYNRAEKQKRMDALSRQLKDKEVLAGEALAARVLSVGKILDGYNSMLEYAATGKISTTPDITPGEYSQIVDDVIANRIAQKGDSFAANVYRSGTEVIDAVPSYVVGGPILSSIRSAAESATEKLKKEKASGASDKEAVTNAFKKGAWEATVDTGAKAFSEYLPFKDGKYSSGEKKREIMGETAASVVKELADLDEYKKAFKKQGYSDKQAEHIAIFEAIKKGGMNALDNIALTAAQKKFYDSLRKSLSRIH